MGDSQFTTGPHAKTNIHSAVHIYRQFRVTNSPILHVLGGGGSWRTLGGTRTDTRRMLKLQHTRTHTGTVNILLVNQDYCRHLMDLVQFQLMESIYAARQFELSCYFNACHHTVPLFCFGVHTFGYQQQPISPMTYFFYTIETGL